MKRRPVSPLVSSDILKLSNYRCFYCSAPFTNENPYTIDHIIPISRGGTNSRRNLVAACRKCNTQKGSKFLGEVFRERKDFEDRIRTYLGLSEFEISVLRWTRRIRTVFGFKPVKPAKTTNPDELSIAGRTIWN